MKKRCDICTKPMGLFSHPVSEAMKDGICLCKGCYDSLWKKQTDTVAQSKRLAEIALNGQVGPEIKKIIVRHIKDILPSVDSDTTTLETPETTVVENSTVQEKDPNVTTSIKTNEEKNTGTDLFIPIVTRTETEEVSSKNEATEVLSTLKEPGEERVGNSPFNATSPRESITDDHTNDSEESVIEVTDSAYPGVHFWADKPISVNGIVIEKPFIYTIGESELQKEIDQHTIQCDYKDNPYLEYYQMFFTNEQIEANKDSLSSYLDPNSYVMYSLVLPKDGKLQIPQAPPTTEELDRLFDNIGNIKLYSLNKEQSGSFVKWLSNYYPKFEYIRYFSSAYMYGVWYRAFVEKKDTRAFIHFFGAFLLSGANYSHDEKGNQNIDVLKWFLSLLLTYVQNGNELNEEEKKLVLDVIKTVLESRGFYYFKEGWGWDPLAILHECGIEDQIPQWLIIKQYLARISEKNGTKYNESLESFLVSHLHGIEVVYKEYKTPVGCLHISKNCWEYDVSYYTSWELSDSRKIDSIFESFSGDDFKVYLRLPSYISKCEDKAEWFSIPQIARNEIPCPLSNEDLSTLLASDRLIRDVFNDFGYSYDRYKAIPKNSVTAINGIDHVYHCLGYRTNLVAGLSLDDSFVLTKIQ